MGHQRNLIIKNVIFTLVIFITSISVAQADQSLISIFPLKNYLQNISTWIKPNDSDFNRLLLSKDMQQKRLDIFMDHYYGELSPWNESNVKRILDQVQPDDLKTIEQSVIASFSNKNKPATEIGYGENFRPYNKKWIEKIATNIDISQFDHLSYQIVNRGIAIDNLHARALPTDDVYLYSHTLAGQGYPFDNLQISALWAGTPVYIIGETKDHAWMLVMTPDYIGWVKSRGIARADQIFVNTFTKAAKDKLIAITHTETSITDDKGNYLFSAYVGSVFPSSTSATNFRIMVPVADMDHHALIKQVAVSSEHATPMPLVATPHEFSNIIHTLIARPYGWGNMYFYNDCSSELKNMLTPFGIWLPRHSSEQVRIGKMVDMSHATASTRLAYLMQNGQRFLTLVYIGNHVVMYIGNYTNPNNNNSLMAMTYQNVWGLSPHPSVRRAVIGKSVLFPMLLQYPEDTSLVSLADKKYFQISYLNQLPNSINNKVIDLKSLMFPEIL